MINYHLAHHLSEGNSHQKAASIVSFDLDTEQFDELIVTPVEVGI